MRQLMRFMAVFGGAVVLSVLVASSTVAAKGSSDIVECPTPARRHGQIHQRAGDFPDPMRIDSDVVLTTAAATGAKRSTANGHCTFYVSTGTGLCTYQNGTHALAGFRAVWVVGPVAAHVFSVIGKYSIGRNND